MKKLVIPFMLFIILSTTLVFAGDIPESLMHSEDAQIFFGEVLSYHPNKVNPDIEVAIVEVIKGDIKKGTKHIYLRANPMGDFNIQDGKVYLFTYYDDANTTDIFEVTTYNTKTLKLKHVQGNMWERFEKYLNQGKYGEAKVDGMLPYRVDITYGIVGFIICVLFIIIVYKRKNNKSKGE